MSRKGAVTIPTWILYGVIFVAVIVVVYYAVPGANVMITGFATTIVSTVSSWAGTITSSEIWINYWYLFVGAGTLLVFWFGRWTMKKQSNLLGYLAQKARLKAIEADPTLGMGGYGYGAGGPSGPGGGMTPEQIAAQKKLQEALP